MLVHQKWHTKDRGITYTHKPHVSVANLSRELLEFVKTTIGHGHVRLKSNGVWCFEVRHAQAIAFLRRLRPWIRLKRQEVDLVMEFHRVRGRKQIGGRYLYTDQSVSREYCERLRALHYRLSLQENPVRRVPCSVPYSSPPERILNGVRLKVRVMKIPRQGVLHRPILPI